MADKNYTLNLSDKDQPLISEDRDPYVQSFLSGINLRFPSQNKKDIRLLADLFL